MLWPQLAERLGIDGRRGALVQEVEAGSPAEDAGLEAGDDEINFQGQPDILTGGDVIVAVDGERAHAQRRPRGRDRRHGAGDEVALTVVRDGERRAVEVELGRRRRRAALDADRCRALRGSG